jgi:Flp pilus assembly pilin Flp
MIDYIQYILNALARDEEGQTMTEYALILALVVVVAAAALSPLGTAIAGEVGTVAGQL